MELDVTKSLVEYMIHGGATAIISLLLLVAGYLIWDRKDLIRMISDTTQKVYDAKDAEKQVILDIVDKYHQGNATVTQTLSEIKIVLQIMQSKM